MKVITYVVILMNHLLLHREKKERTPLRLEVEDTPISTGGNHDGHHFKILPFYFLNTDYDPLIIHEDIKSSNILLYGRFCDSIMYFGHTKFKSDVDVVAKVLDVQGHAISDAKHRVRNYG
ncbi:hypothetical protein SUGI_0541000 [Cryptomeria japonica]|nr:hypothetical protein SUGI_0541000 [Cryptomeria japonica]